MNDWQDMSTAPKDQTVILGKLPNGQETRMIWGWGGGWAGSWAGDNAWLQFNDAHQPVQWKHIYPIKKCRQAMGK